MEAAWQVAMVMWHSLTMMSVHGSCKSLTDWKRKLTRNPRNGNSTGTSSHTPPQREQWEILTFLTDLCNFLSGEFRGTSLSQGREKSLESSLSVGQYISVAPTKMLLAQQVHNVHALSTTSFTRCCLSCSRMFCVCFYWKLSPTRLLTLIICISLDQEQSLLASGNQTWDFCLVNYKCVDFFFICPDDNAWGNYWQDWVTVWWALGLNDSMDCHSIILKKNRRHFPRFYFFLKTREKIQKNLSSISVLKM